MLYEKYNGILFECDHKRYRIAPLNVWLRRRTMSYILDSKKFTGERNDMLNDEDSVYLSKLITFYLVYF